MHMLLFLAVSLVAQTSCADMGRLPNVTAAIQTATYCRVSITLRRAADSEIKSEVWLPTASEWNGKLLMEGGGGLVGIINTEGMTHAVREGYASASTDTGHTGSSGRFALGHPDKITDFAYRAVHETAVEAKALIAAYYGRSPRLSYWEGCSTGGLRRHHRRRARLQSDLPLRLAHASVDDRAQVTTTRAAARKTEATQ